MTSVSSPGPGSKQRHFVRQLPGWGELLIHRGGGLSWEPGGVLLSQTVTLGLRAQATWRMRLFIEVLSEWSETSDTSGHPSALPRPSAHDGLLPLSRGISVLLVSGPWLSVLPLLGMPFHCFSGSSNSS